MSMFFVSAFSLTSVKKQGVVNIPYERYFVPVEAPDLANLVHCVMLRARIFNVHVQQCSRIILGRTATRGTVHRFSEDSLCKAVAPYEAAGLFTVL